MERVRVGVIGVGHWGQHHVRLYGSLSQATLVGVVDFNPERAGIVANHHQVTVFKDLTALLKEVEAVSVAVPTSAHHHVGKACLEAGVHVLMEKPIAVKVNEARELVELAQKRGLILQVGHIERFNPGITALRPYIRRPTFIECHRLSPFGERGTDVDVVLDLMIHDLDMILSFDPGPVEEVKAAGMPVLSPNIDIANARIVFRSGCVANVTASRVSTDRLRHLRLFQRDGYLSLDYQTRQGVICRRHANDGERPRIEVEQVRGGDDEPLRSQLEAFLQAVLMGIPPPVTGEHGTAALDLAQQVLEAIARFMQHHTGEAGVCD